MIDNASKLIELERDRAYRRAAIVPDPELGPCKPAPCAMRMSDPHELAKGREYGAYVAKKHDDNAKGACKLCGDK